MRRTRRTEDGVTIVEAAFAIPILFMFVMGMVDLGLWAFNANQATNAARDGARMAIIDYRQADVEGSATWDAIVDRVEEHLPGRTIEPDDIQIACVRADGGSGCAGAHPDRDRIQVEVTWSWQLLTPIAAVIGLDEGEASGTATMTLLGMPGAPPPPSPPSSTTSTSTTTTTTTTSTTVVGTCAVSGISVSPSFPRVNGSGQLEKIDISFTTAGDGCAGVAVQLTPPDSTQVQSATCKSCSGANQVWTYSLNEKVWSTGQGTIRVFNGVVDASAGFTVT